MNFVWSGKDKTLKSLKIALLCSLSQKICACWKNSTATRTSYSQIFVLSVTILRKKKVCGFIKKKKCLCLSNELPFLKP